MDVEAPRKSGAEAAAAARCGFSTCNPALALRDGGRRASLAAAVARGALSQSVGRSEQEVSLKSGSACCCSAAAGALLGFSAAVALPPPPPPPSSSFLVPPQASTNPPNAEVPPMLPILLTFRHVCSIRVQSEVLEGLL